MEMSVHKYAELAHKLREDIQGGVYGNGQKLPSENELAAQTGYSRQTVRQAMSILENEGLTSRVQGSGTYVRSTVPRRRVTKNIAVVTTYIGEYIFPAILYGIDQVLVGGGYTSMLSATQNRVDTERRILGELLRKPIDGLIVEGTKTALPNPNLDLYHKLADQGLPVVFINGFYPNLQNPIYVVADDRAGGRMACQALLDKGCKRVAGIFKSDDIQGHRRYAGYVEALQAQGLAVEDGCVLWFSTENRDSLLASSTLALLKDCGGVVCYNDEVALQVLKQLQEQPDRGAGPVEVVSFDNSIYAQMSATPFVSLANPKEKLGRLAAQKLLGLLQGQEEQSVVLPWSTTH